MEEACGTFENGANKFRHVDSSTYHLLLDWLQPFKHSEHSTGVLAIHCTDTANQHAAKSFNSKILAISRGKLQCARSFLLRTLKTLADLSTGETTLQIRERYVVRNGDTVTRTFNHIPFLTGFRADSIGR